MASKPEQLRALSIRQPWAKSILRGEKTVECRSQSTNVRGRVYIYASLTRIAQSYDAWRGVKVAGKYADIAGFCKSTSREEIESHDHVLTPGRYVGAEETEDEDDMPFDVRTERLTAKLKGQFTESVTFAKAILKNLAGLGFTGKESS